jgi:hypothetical protein
MPETVVINAKHKNHSPLFQTIITPHHRQLSLLLVLLLLRTHSLAASPRPGSAGLIALVLLPVGENVADARGGSQAVDVLEVLLGQLEGTSGDVGDVLADKLAGVDGSLVDLLEEERAERLDAGAQESGVERHVDALEGDCGETALQVDGLGLGFGLLGALFDDGGEVLLDFFEGDGLHQLLDVDLLGLEVVENVGEAVERAEVTGANVLLVLDVQVDDLEEPGGGLGDVLDDILQGLLGEGLADTRRVDGAHGVVGAALLVTLDGDLHGQTAVEHDGDEGLDGHDLGHGGQSTVLSKRVTSECAVALNDTLVTHILERGLLHKCKGGLSELRRREETGGGAVGVRAGVLVDLLENLLRLDASVGGYCLESHGHVVLADGLATSATEVNGELVGVVLDNVGDGKA